MLIYVPVFLFAIIEGEIYYITMCVAAGAGKLAWQGVLVAGALGGATGDQIWFYLLRGRIHWLDRYPWMARHRDAVVHRVRDNKILILLISRFLPGLRTAIPIASAYAGVKRWQFSLLNLTSAFLWAGAIMLVVTKVGPGAMDRLGLHGWWGALVPAALVLLFFNWLGRPRRKKVPLGHEHIQEDHRKGHKARRES
ncbi:MAG TPA: VTT domain-containing protein [Vicinamibacterales bacterium]|nr:VTT domain-containing protein [Vicinamibacterales bacterium]